MTIPAWPSHPIPRSAESAARRRLSSFPALAITGPRQSGKTTFARMLAPDHAYYSLEDPDTRAYAEEDPRAFLGQAGTGEGAILDEIQRAPGLFSYLQGTVDADPRPGRFILTGSSQFELIESITQTLAGRVAALTLLPFSLGELQAAGRGPESLNRLLHEGLFPPIHDRSISPSMWLQEYVGAYLERDVRQVLAIRDLNAFQRFVGLCAGRIGQLLNITSLAADAGVTRVTANAWISVLQASHLLFLVRPWFANISKRLVKSPKLYFCDPGLATWLLGVRMEEQLAVHPLRGAIFENWMITELLKVQTNGGLRPVLHFLRDKSGHEIDAIVEPAPNQLHAVEMKSGQTVATDFFSGLDYWRDKLSTRQFIAWLVYGGDERQNRRKTTVLPWNRLGALLETLGGPN